MNEDYERAPVERGVRLETNLAILLQEEKEELHTLYEKWELARCQKRWAEADRLRAHLNMWDSNIVNDKIWHPHFENNLNRQRRAALRIKKYGIPVYPWELTDAT